MKRTVLARLFLVGAVGLFGPLGAANADTLTDTLIKAYQLSPRLEAARAGLRAQDEGVAQARSGRRPSVSAGLSASAGASDAANWSISDSYRASLDAALTLYDGGVTANAIEAAKAAVSAGRAELKDVEQAVLYDAVSAFMNVRRDGRFVSLALNNVAVLEQQVQASTDRFEVGEVTRTDVSLSQARLAAARANLAASRGQLDLSEAEFAAVVGIAPRDLQPPPRIPDLPASLAEVEAIAMREHPVLTAARFAEVAAEFDLRRTRAGNGLSVRLSGNVDATRSDNALGQQTDNASVGASVSASVPLYQGGRMSSLERQAAELLARRKSETQNTARLIRQNAAAAWSNLTVARASIVANREQVEAAQIAVNGVREEAQLGARTTLDVLDREQELRDAQFGLVSAQRDEYVAAYGVLAAMGLLSVSHLNLGIESYDPDVNFRRVQNAPFTTFDGGIVDRLRDRYGR